MRMRIGETVAMALLTPNKLYCDLRARDSSWLMDDYKVSFAEVVKT